MWRRDMGRTVPGCAPLHRRVVGEGPAAEGDRALKQLIGWTGAVKRVLLLFDELRRIAVPIANAPIAVLDGVPIFLPEALGAALVALGLLLP